MTNIAEMQDGEWWDMVEKVSIGHNMHDRRAKSDSADVSDLFQLDMFAPEQLQLVL